MKNVVSFEPKSWWKDDIYWLRKGSCFELFGGEKYGLFGVKKLMEKIIFAGFREVLVLNFSVWEIRSFFQRKSWWKDYIYLVFLSFPWYSRTWEIRFFMQCLLFSFRRKYFVWLLLSISFSNKKARNVFVPWNSKSNE